MSCVSLEKLSSMVVCCVFTATRREAREDHPAITCKASISDATASIDV